MSKKMRLRGVGCVLVAGISLIACGCAFGPKQLERTHGRYSEAIHRVDEQELLLNLVHTRYCESPLGLDVTAIAAQWELSGSAEAKAFFEAPNPNNLGFKTFSTVLPDLMFGAADRPTVSMKPALDGAAVRQFLTPISADTLVFLTQSGWPVSSVFRLWFERINGVPNATPIGGPPHDSMADHLRFRRITELIQIARDQELLSLHSEDRSKALSSPMPAESVTSAAIVDAAKNGFEYRKLDDGKSWALVKIEKKLVLQITPGAESAPEMMELKSLLNLRPDAGRFDIDLVTGGVIDPMRHPSEPTAAIRIHPRAIAQVFGFLANGVDVPAEHINSGLIRPTTDANGQMIDPRNITEGLFQVHCCKSHQPPACAYVAAKYRGYWFYIDDRDQASKESFALVSLLSRLDFKRQRLITDGGPSLTLPVGR